MWIKYVKQVRDEQYGRIRIKWREEKEMIEKKYKRETKKDNKNRSKMRGKAAEE